MKKNLIATLVTMAVLLGGGSNVKSMTLDEQYKQAYNMAMNAVSAGQEYGVKPFYKEGSSPLENVVGAVAEGDLQNEILTARQYINALPSSIQILKNTLSSMLDDYQHPIYESIVKTAVGSNEALTPEVTTINDTSNLAKSLLGIGVIDTEIYWGQLLIQDVPQPFKSSYSSALDQSKQKVLNFYVDLVNLAEKTKNESLKNYALSMFQFEKGVSTNGDAVINFINSLNTRVNNIVTNSAITEKEMIDAANKNVFSQISNLSSLPYGIARYVDAPDFKQAFKKEVGSTQLYLIVCTSGVNLYSSDSNLTGALELIKELAPTESDKIIASAKAKETNGFLTENGLTATVAYNSEENYSLVSFLTFK